MKRMLIRWAVLGLALFTAGCAGKNTAGTADAGSRVFEAGISLSGKVPTGTTDR